MKTKKISSFLKQWLAVFALVPFFALNIFFGSLDIPATKVVEILFSSSEANDASAFIILQSRLPQAIVAMLCGASLSVAGLLLQTAFRNPLAGPSIFGITGSATALGFQLSIVVAAFVGASIVTAIVLALSSIVRSNTMLLIVGIMIGYIASSAITLLNYFASEEGVRNYLLWGMGNFGDVSLQQLPLFTILSLVGILASLMLIKPLNTLLLGDRYAENLGINIRRVRNQLLIVTGLLTAVSTAYCGPVAFLGLAVPHIARLVTNTENHRQLLPSTILCGAIVALLCNFLTTLPPNGTLLPLNAITPLIGAPVIIYVVLLKR